MFKSMSRGEIEYYRKQYPAGTRIKLNAMDDPYNPVPPGTMGTVQRIDDVGNMHMQWDNGRTLALVIGHDTIGYFIDTCPDKELLGKVKEHLIPMQMGEVEPKVFFCPTAQEANAYCNQKAAMEMGM